MWNKSVKSKMSQQKKVSCVTILFVSLLVFMLVLPSLNNLIYAQISGRTSTTTSLPDPNMLIIMVNIERIRNQILLTEMSLAADDKGMAFAHSYIPHSAIYPSIKSQLNNINSQSALRLESLLTDLPIIIKTFDKAADSKSKIKNDLTEIEELLDNMSNQSIGQDLLSNKTMIAHTIVFLLRDAGKSYQLSNAAAVSAPINQQETDNNKKFSKVDYENALGLVNVSRSNYEKISYSIDERRREEISSFFQQIENSISQKTDQESVLRLITAIERDLSEELSLSEGSERTGEHTKYFSTIRTLLSNIITEVKENGDYKEADKNAITAYLDNYEYLEAPIEKHDPQLMVDIEIDMREELRQMLRERESPENLESFINGILEKIDIAEDLLKNDPSFNQLQESGNI